MARKPTWYQQGFNDALAGLPSDPPWFRGNPHHESYVEGFADGARQAESNAFHADDVACPACEGDGGGRFGKGGCSFCEASGIVDVGEVDSIVATVAMLRARAGDLPLGTVRPLPDSVRELARARPCFA